MRPDQVIEEAANDVTCNDDELVCIACHPDLDVEEVEFSVSIPFCTYHSLWIQHPPKLFMKRGRN